MSTPLTKAAQFSKVADLLQNLAFTINQKDDSRPWGGFYVIEEGEAARFARHFFPEEDIEELKLSEKLSPKILLVAPNARLSWQYHFRRAEIWKCIEGTVEVIHSHDDAQREKNILQVGDIIKLPCGTRHRLVGTKQWGIVAEIWQHTDAAMPSDEEDIVRLEDDYGRTRKLP